MAISESAPPIKVAEPRRPSGRLWKRILVAFQVIQVRLRFVLVLAVAFLIVGKWDTIRSYWDTLVRLGGAPNTTKPISSDTEYFCPMCPGVVSEWPIKCPVCFMSLVRRAKGDSTPLPDGVVARMQLSPYRLQLAGIQTSPVSYEPLAHEILTGGFVESSAKGKPHLEVRAEIYEKDLPFLKTGQHVELTCQATSGALTGTIQAVNAEARTGFGPLKLVVQIEDPRGEVRPGLFVQLRARTSLAQQETAVRKVAEDWQRRSLIAGIARSLVAPTGIAGSDGMEYLYQAAQRQLMVRQGLLLAVPETAVVDTGRQKVVYVETGPGMFDGVEVRLGPRCGAHYEVWGGMEFGQRVATTGAFLLDAEARLNPSLAAGYFGASRNREAASANFGSEEAAIEQALSKLSPADRKLAEQQKTCPVTGGQLGSMGTPVRIQLGEKIVFLCCKACEPAARKQQK